MMEKRDDKGAQMYVSSRLSIDVPDPVEVDRVDDLTLSQAAELVGEFDEFLGRLIGRFYEMGIEDCDDMEMAVCALLGSHLGDCSHHRSFRIQDLVIRLRTRVYEDGEALAAVRGFGH